MADDVTRGLRFLDAHFGRLDQRVDVVADLQRQPISTVTSETTSLHTISVIRPWLIAASLS
jgi:hypothetical protein